MALSRLDVTLAKMEKVNFDWSNVSILIVDDDSDLLETLCDIFKYLGANVYSALDGDEAVIQVQSKKINLVLSDLQMPKMDGATLLKIITEKKLKIPFIFITGQSHFTEETALKLGAQGLIYKPYILKTMLDKIQNIFINSRLAII